MEPHTTSYRALRLSQVIDKTSNGQLFRMVKAEIDAWLKSNLLGAS